MKNLLPIIGLEIHVRLKTRSKMFCGCPNVGEDTPVNTAICPVCTGQPGALPAVNDEAIRLGVRAGLALGCTIPNTAHFDRKNYFYPDLPKGYQISQFDFPIAINGLVVIDVPENIPERNPIKIGITRAHLEEDAAKNIHDGGSGKTLVDFNRASNPLLEIVTEPDFRSPMEAKLFLQELQAILRMIGVSDADMEKGYMRCDANVSLLEIDEKGQRLGSGLNPKIEVKNLNSFRAVERALAHEIVRQQAVYEKDEVPQGATRGWDENKGETFEQRLKETSADYRYFPEPDLPPLDLTKIREEEKNLPELPSEKRLRFIDEFGFSPEDAKFLVANEDWAEFAEQVMSELKEWTSTQHATRNTHHGKLAGGWMTSKYVGLLSQKNVSLEESKITPENFAEFLKLVDDSLINSANAQKLLALMIDTGSDPSHLLEEHNLGQNEDPEVLTKTVALIIEQNEDQVKQVKAGKLGVIKWFVGGVMKATEGRANPEKAEAEVKKQLGI